MNSFSWHNRKVHDFIHNDNHWIILVSLSILLVLRPVIPDTLPQSEEQGYRIEQPGTITFTVGVKISGKVEKPQVMIFLPKEKTLYRKESFDYSFIEELSQPLPFTPVLE